MTELLWFATGLLVGISAALYMTKLHIDQKVYEGTRKERSKLNMERNMLATATDEFINKTLELNKKMDETIKTHNLLLSDYNVYARDADIREKFNQECV